MAAADHQDSNRTGLRYAVEDSPGVLPGSPIWYPLEPNDYKDFGGEYKTVARRPINKSRQRKKGTLVDLDAKGGFGQDLTADNATDLLQSVLFAALRTKAELAATATTTSDDHYTVASGGRVYEVNDLIFAKGADEAANNGLKTVVSSTTTNVLVAENLVDSSAQAITISRVGYEFGTGLASINVAGSFPKFVVANTAASELLTTDNTNAADTSTVTITGADGNVTVYQFQTTLTAGVAGNVHVHIGVDADTSLLNLARAINNSGGTPGVDYSTVGTLANADVTASTSVTAHHIAVTARLTGAAGNEITVVCTSSAPDSHIDPAGATLTGGVGRDLTTLGLIPGEPSWICGDDPTEKFAAGTGLAGTGAANGYARVRNVTAGYFEIDKADNTWVTDDGTSTGSAGTNNKTIRIFFGRVLKNEDDEDTSHPIIARTLQLERTLGAPDTGSPTAIQAEYLPSSLPNEFVFDMKTADKVTFNVTFLSGTHELNTSVDGLKAGSRPTIQDQDCFNTTNDVWRIKMQLVDDTDEDPDPLFLYLTDLNFAIKNNIKQNKAVGVLGAFSTTAGIFEVSADVTAYFTDVTAIQAIRSNESVTVDMFMTKNNKGVAIDIPLVALGKAIADVKIDEPIMLPLTADAASGAQIDTDLDFTMLMSFFDYLPDLADASNI